MGGKIIKFDKTNSLDLYAKYFYLFQSGDSFNAGGKYKLSDVHSHRLRLAGRYSHNFTSDVALYCGLGTEYEFDGKTKLKVDEVSAEPSEVDGLRGYGELGVAVKPSTNSLFILDFNVKGLYGEDYRGASLNADIKYMF